MDNIFILAICNERINRFVKAKDKLKISSIKVMQTDEVRMNIVGKDINILDNYLN